VHDMLSTTVSVTVTTVKEYENECHTNDNDIAFVVLTKVF